MESRGEEEFKKKKSNTDRGIEGARMSDGCTMRIKKVFHLHFM